MKILIIDNYDSFTYNLVHYVKELGFSAELDIFRNDEIQLSAIESYDKILISPGPGIPDEAGITKELILAFGSSKKHFRSLLGASSHCRGIRC